jgi:NTP pyrophosphatase (non-canonical NTP hydrolase)
VDEFIVLIADYDAFVRDSDQSAGKPLQDRIDIAIYGLAAELGSLVAAMKKRLLAEGGVEEWNAPNEEIVEELGDVIWYCFALARLTNAEKPINIFAHDIANLKREIGADDERAKRIQGVLDPAKRDEFLKAAEQFPKRTKVMEFEDYQTVAFLTARTPDRTLVEVCLAVLWQLAAELFRQKLPPIELELNKAVVDRPINHALGEIAWHVSALASIFGLKLSDIARANMDKVSFRLDRSHPTPLHDDDDLPTEQFPRKFEIALVTVAKGRSRMYLDGRQLGDDLTDNSYADDGYRFHDIMHLANVAKLGWSPVLRGLLGRKRKSKPQKDEVEDGARAKIVEEAVIKAIHSEGQRLASLRGPQPTDRPVRLFTAPSDITFRFLKFIRNFVAGLEVEENRYWEWEEAILQGHDIFYRLRCEGQGTVKIDLDARSISFEPDVCMPFAGKVVGMGSATCGSDGNDDRNTVVKDAILRSLGVAEPTSSDRSMLVVKELSAGISVKASGAVQQAMWARRVVTFQTTVIAAPPNGLHATAIALAD